ncbi:MAG: T9SS type A sorting domain-containing protein [Candidatus Marinimicrobia bacterium]|nr:T9SS type A sorting domain-containing protein [Candidatus Neomarinimicrobiota bacterium]
MLNKKQIIHTITKMNLLIGFMTLVSGIEPIHAGVLPTYEHISTTFTKTVDLDYLLYKPPGYRANESYALVIYLTGIEAIDDLDQVRSAGPPFYLDQGMKHDFFLAAPQLPGDEHWDPDAIHALIEDLSNTYHIDPSRLYITGIGDRGGFGAYETAVSYPETFSRLAPISSPACTNICRIGPNCETWIFHGALDSLVPPADAENMQYEIDYYCDQPVTLTTYDTLGHEIWDEAYSEAGFWEWFVGSAPSYGTPTVPSVNNLSLEINKSIEDNYLFYLPVGYEDSEADWPLMIYLHGSGGAIGNIDEIRVTGPPRRFEEGMDSDFILICPQLYDDVQWDIDRLHALTQEILDKYRINHNRIMITGMSRGGFGAWEYAVTYPWLFSAVVPISARDVPGVERIAHSNIWIYHGALDTGVPWEGAQFMYDRLNRAGANVKLTLYPNVGHWAWEPAYASVELWEWMLSQRNIYTSIEHHSESVPTDYFLDQNYPNPFNPVTTIRFGIPKNAFVSVVIFDLQGTQIRTLAASERPAGQFELIWNGLTDTGQIVPSGIYLSKLDVGDISKVVKMMFLK